MEGSTCSCLRKFPSGRAGGKMSLATFTLNPSYIFLKRYCLCILRLFPRSSPQIVKRKLFDHYINNISLSRGRSRIKGFVIETALTCIFIGQHLYTKLICWQTQTKRVLIISAGLNISLSRHITILFIPLNTESLSLFTYLGSVETLPMFDQLWWYAIFNVLIVINFDHIVYCALFITL